MSKQFKRLRLTVKGDENKKQPGKHFYNEVGFATVFSDSPIPDDLTMMVDIHLLEKSISGFVVKPKEQKKPEANGSGAPYTNPFDDGGPN